MPHCFLFALFADLEENNGALWALVGDQSYQKWKAAFMERKESSNELLFSLDPLPDVAHDEAYVRAEAHNHANSLNRTVTLR